jgi:hypothetical protein
MNLLTLVEQLVLESRQEEILRKEFLETGKVSEECFNEIMGMYPSSFANKWLLLRVANGAILEEDVYKFKEYIDIFAKHNKKFPITDLGQIKTSQQIDEFIGKAIEIKERNIQAVGGEDSKIDPKNLVSGNDIAKLESVGIKFLGIVDGYQCFEVPTDLVGNTEAYSTYKAILAKCAGRDEGASIAICTMGSQGHFDSYLRNGPYFVFYNLSDKKSPYQFHYESNQFKDKNNLDLI